MISHGNIIAGITGMAERIPNLKYGDIRLAAFSLTLPSFLCLRTSAKHHTHSSSPLSTVSETQLTLFSTMSVVEIHLLIFLFWQ